MIDEKQLLNREWRLENLYVVKNKDGQAVPFKPNKAQKHFDQSKHCKNIILKSRQLGFSTFECIDSLDEVLFSDERVADVRIIGHNKDAMEDLFEDKIEFAWKNLGNFDNSEESRLLSEDLKSFWGVDTSNAKEYAFGIDDVKNPRHVNRISVVTSARSGSPTRIHVTELSTRDEEAPKRAEEIISGALPAIPSGTDGRFDIESTAKDASGIFYRMCMEAYEKQKNGEPLTSSDFKFHFYNWQWDEYGMSKISPKEVKTVMVKMPEEFLKYREEKKKFDNIELTDKELVYYYKKYLELKSAKRGNPWAILKKEYPTTVEEAFDSTENPLFSERKIKESPIIEPIEVLGRLKIFKKHISSHVYGLGADVAEGVDQDSSTFEIIDYMENEVVASFDCNQTDPTAFAYELVKGANLFGECAIGVELNNHGHATIQKLREIYPVEKIYRTIKKDKARNEISNKLGWESTGASKTAMLYVLISPVGDYFTPGAQMRVLLNTEDLRCAPHIGAVKTGGNYASALGLVMRANEKYGTQQVIFAPNGDVQETAAANCLLINDNEVITKGLSSEFLPGMTRDSILQLAKSMGYQVTERNISADELIEWAKTGEVALSGTAAVIAPVTEIVYRDEINAVAGGAQAPNAMKLRQALNDIQCGKAEDIFNWVTSI